jgi:hypothetical protein
MSASDYYDKAVKQIADQRKFELRKNLFQQFREIESLLFKAELVRVKFLQYVGEDVYWELFRITNTSDRAGLMLSANGNWLIVKATPEQQSGLASLSLSELAFRHNLDVTAYGGFNFIN